MILFAVSQTGFVERRKDPEDFERRLGALTAIAGVDAGRDLASFCADLTARVATLVEADKVLFSIVADGLLVAQPGTHGFGPEIYALAVPCTPAGSDFADEIVYHDMVFRGAITDDPSFSPYRHVLAIMQVSNAIAVAVKSGSEPIGLLAAFDSQRAEGFSDEDIRLLQIAAAAAGLLWRHKQSADEARSLNEAIRSMVNAMVHELRAPLTVMHGYLDMLTEASFGPIPPAMVKPVITIKTKLDDAMNLVEELLLSARLESGAVESNREPVDLGELATSVADQETSRAQLAGGAVSIAKPAEPVRVLADRRHLATIVGNLVRNAITYRRGVPEVQIQVTGEPRPTILVTDRGKGMSPEVQAHIFERFYRALDRTNPPGTGLGLYISRQLARQEGGELVLDWSELGRGSAFALRLPEA